MWEQNESKDVITSLQTTNVDELRAITRQITRQQWCDFRFRHFDDHIAREVDYHLKSLFDS